MSKCEHGKRKSRCVSCNGSQICEHKKVKSRCKLCGGTEICIHEKRKSACKLCDGSSFCEHGRKSICKQCIGSSFCEHGRQKSQCKQCNGVSICEHIKRKNYCKKCGGSSLCKSEWCETFGNKKYDGFCLRCFIHIHPEIHITRNYKTKENDVVDRIKLTFPGLNWVHDKRVQDGYSRRRPDLLLDMGSHVIIIEIDENKHTDYDCSCENKRLMEISQDLHHRSIVFIRFNPDQYINQDGIMVESCWELNYLNILQVMKPREPEWRERILVLENQIQFWIDNPTEKTVEIIELFY